MIFVSLCFGFINYAFLINVSPGKADYEYEVGNGSYVLIRSSAHYITISPKDATTSEIEGIPEKVVEIAWDSRYVIAKQFGMKLESVNSTYKIPDETIVNYWILDTENKVRFGPYKYEEFVVKLGEFDIMDLELRPVREFAGN